MDTEILDVIRKKGLLIERDVFDLLESFHDKASAKSFLENLERVSGQKMITRNVLSKNVEYIRSFVGNLEDDSRKVVEKVIVNLGISLEVRREKEVVKESTESGKKYKIELAETANDKKLEVRDFVGHFRARFQQLQRILMSRPELQKNLVSINKIGGERSMVGIIGIVSEKRITKNKNLMLKFEDMTGEIKGLVKFDREEIFAKAEELQLDDIVGVKASGNRDILFVHDIFYPDAFLHEKTKFREDVNIAFISDIHCGSKKHLGESFEKFLEWLNSEHEDALKIRYLFIVGDTIDGVGIFPGQENVLELGSMGEQYAQLAGYLKRVPRRITMFLCPGQHDASRVAEPQPIVSKKYAHALYNIDNLVLVTNPCFVRLLEDDKEFKVLMYHGGSIHTFINEIRELREMKAHNCPAKAIKHMLKRRHLAPMYGLSNQIIYVPNSGGDDLVIREVPDVVCTGEVHRLDVDKYNGVLMLTGSCWQGQTDFEEKIGNIPDPCKVPVLNLKSSELKIFDFGIGEEFVKNG